MSEVPLPDHYVYGWSDAPEFLYVMGPLPEGGSVATYPIVVTGAGSWYVYVEAKYSGYRAMIFGGAVTVPIDFRIPEKVGSVSGIKQNPEDGQRE